ncbi:MAG: zinc ribbon domain-containing protein [Candidatus Dadabacteria bacterium]|nr:zinc ribbon domain-containing protein [Candidatus Dadabacteria bacterium]NIS07425.1 zinc ribbon domain-containing protein [Candidatus Dadabacteria bacterium]NIV41615.1 zinc ribbon domain-containing protein [Candidatus Dadabacteria bacterium]NIX14618.1 zinc ribbon domain-containing protein [Candidatus Dadabacteria bacterium]NIY21081.1 zinc ribbon domain-containing protein [Candidatus Dadabacteria bacterium]
MKKCPFCAEYIQDDAIKCRYCNELLDKKEQKPKWYYTNTGTIIALLAIGPFALPLVWLNPHYKTHIKILITIIVLGSSIWFYYATKDIYEAL